MHTRYLHNYQFPNAMRMEMNQPTNHNVTNSHVHQYRPTLSLQTVEIYSLIHLKNKK